MYFKWEEIDQSRSGLKIHGKDIAVITNATMQYASPLGAKKKTKNRKAKNQAGNSNFFFIL